MLSLYNSNSIMAKELTKISLKTVPNGYSLEVNGEGFMYFNEVDLLGGFMAHVGLQDTRTMERGSVLNCLFSAMMGEAYSNAVTTLKQRVALLTGKYEGTLEQMDNSIEYVNQAEKTIQALQSKIERLSEEVKALSQEQTDVSVKVKDYQTKINAVYKKSDEVMNSLANSATILKAMEETKKGKKNADKHADKSADESAHAPEDESGSTEVRKGKGGRNKKADEAVLREIEAQAKENPNLK